MLSLGETTAQCLRKKDGKWYLKTFSRATYSIMYNFGGDTHPNVNDELGELVRFASPGYTSMNNGAIIALPGSVVPILLISNTASVLSGSAESVCLFSSLTPVSMATYVAFGSATTPFYRVDFGAKETVGSYTVLSAGDYPPKVTPSPQ